MNYKKMQDFCKKLQIVYPKKELIEFIEKEIIEDRDRIHEINLECARLGIARAIFDDIESWMGGSELTDLSNCTCDDCNKYRQMKEKHLNTNNTEKLKEGEHGREKEY